MRLGQVTAYWYPFGVGVILGLSYDTFEEEWYGSTIADHARPSHRVRLFLKNFVDIGELVYVAKTLRALDGVSRVSAARESCSDQF